MPIFKLLSLRHNKPSKLLKHKHPLEKRSNRDILPTKISSQEKRSRSLLHNIANLAEKLLLHLLLSSLSLIE